MAICLEKHSDIIVLRDDLLPGGTKSILLDSLLPQHYEEYVYATPVYGGFQIALALYCKQKQKKAVIFCAKRKDRHKNTVKIIEAGATVHETPVGYLSVVEKKAREYEKQHLMAYKIPFGAGIPDSIVMIEKRMRLISKQIGYEPDVIFCAVGSGTLVQGILQGTENAKVCGVVVGKDFTFSHPRLTLYHHHLPFERAATTPCPFPSTANYDQKAWEYCLRYSSPKIDGVFFWNVL